MDALLALVVPLAAFVAIAAISLVVIRRASRVLTETRDAERFRRAIDDLAGRIDQSLGAVVARIDLVRRHKLAPTQISDNLAAASDAIRRYTDETKGLHGPAPANEVRANLLAELDRAGRALEMVAHGCSLLDVTAGGHRELEAQTSIKRGYLNALHAREAIARHAAGLASGRPGQPRRWLSRRST